MMNAIHIPYSLNTKVSSLTYIGNTYTKLWLIEYKKEEHGGNTKIHNINYNMTLKVQAVLAIWYILFFPLHNQDYNTVYTV